MVVRGPHGELALVPERDAWDIPWDDAWQVAPTPVCGVCGGEPLVLVMDFKFGETRGGCPLLNEKVLLRSLNIELEQGSRLPFAPFRQ